jgi:hypothetical protein
MNKALEIKRRHERLKRIQSKELRRLSQDEQNEVEDLLGQKLPFPRNPAGHFGIPKQSTGT